MRSSPSPSLADDHSSVGSLSTTVGTAQEVRATALYGGYLSKKGRRTAKMTKRAYFLTSTHLVYYSSMESATPKATLPRADFISVERDPLDRQSFHLHTQSTTKTKDHLLRAPTIDECTEWIEILQKIIKASPSSLDSIQEITPEITPRPNLQTSESEIEPVFLSPEFNATDYARNYFHTHHYENFSNKLQQLAMETDSAQQQLQNRIYQHYPLFIEAATGIQNIHQTLEGLKQDFRVTKQTFTTLEKLTPKFPAVSVDLNQSELQQAAYEKHLSLHYKLQRLDYLLFSKEKARFIQHLDEFKEVELPSYINDQLKTKINLFTQQILQDLNTMLNCSCTEFVNEYEHSFELHLNYLIRIHLSSTASQMCLKGYDLKLSALLFNQQRQGNAIAFVIDLTPKFYQFLRTHSTQFLQLFNQPELLLQLTKWISRQLETFTTLIRSHIFPTIECSYEYSLHHIQAYQVLTKTIVAELRHVFEGAKQFEITGMPIVADLCLHFGSIVQDYMQAYAQSIQMVLNHSLTKERWVTHQLNIRIASRSCISSLHQFILPTKSSVCSIHLTKSCEQFYVHIQQYLKDIHRLLNPAFGTSKSKKTLLACTTAVYTILTTYVDELNLKLRVHDFSPEQIIGIVLNLYFLKLDGINRISKELEKAIPVPVIQQILQLRALENLRTGWQSYWDNACKKFSFVLVSNIVNWDAIDWEKGSELESNGILNMTQLMVEFVYCRQILVRSCRSSPQELDKQFTWVVWDSLFEKILKSKDFDPLIAQDLDAEIRLGIYLLSENQITLSSATHERVTQFLKSLNIPSTSYAEKYIEKAKIQFTTHFQQRQPPTAETKSHGKED